MLNPGEKPRQQKPHPERFLVIHDTLPRIPPGFFPPDSLTGSALSGNTQTSCQHFCQSYSRTTFLGHL